MMCCIGAVHLQNKAVVEDGAVFGLKLICMLDLCKSVLKPFKPAKRQKVAKVVSLLSYADVFFANTPKVLDPKYQNACQ